MNEENEKSIEVKTIGIKIKNGFVSFFNTLDDIFSKHWLKFWSKIQIKLFWFVILTLFGIFIGLWIANEYAEKKINEYITLGAFIHNTQRYDDVKREFVPVSNIYDITKRIR